MPSYKTMPPHESLVSPCHSTAFTVWDDEYHAFSPLLNDAISSAESADSMADVQSTSFQAPISAGYLAGSQTEDEPLTSRYCEAPENPPLGKRRRQPPVKYTAAERSERLLQSAIRASLKPATRARASKPPPVIVPTVIPSPIKGKEPKIEVHGRFYTLSEFSRKYCRLHADPSGKTCKYFCNWPTFLTNRQLLIILLFRRN